MNRFIFENCQEKVEEEETLCSINLNICFVSSVTDKNNFKMAKVDMELKKVIYVKK